MSLFRRKFKDEDYDSLINAYDHTRTVRQAYMDGAYDTHEDFERAMAAAIQQNIDEGHHEGDTV